MAWPAIALAALGAITGIGGMQVGTDISSHSLLSPLQQYWGSQLMGMQSGEMKKYFETLGNIGQNAESPYGALTESKTDFYGNVQLPMLERQRADLKSVLRDPSHPRISDMLMDKMKEQNRIAINQMSSDFENQSRLMKIQGKETSLGNQLSALGMGKGNFWQPMGINMQENYYNPGVSIPGAIGAGISGISSIYSTYQNAQREAREEAMQKELEKLLKQQSQTEYYQNSYDSFRQ